MATKFTDLFKMNSLLNLEVKEQLLSGLAQYAIFEDIFNKTEVSDTFPTKISNLLQTYGPFWVTISKETGGQKNVVLNDITQTLKPEETIVKYYDIETDEIKQSNFTDFVQRVKAGNDDLTKAVVRLKKPIGEGADDELDKKAVVRKSIEKFGDKYFKNATDINDFFREQTGNGFCEWFRKNMKKQGPWGSQSYEYYYDGIKKKHPGRNWFTVHTDADSKFDFIWDRIISYWSWNDKGINIFQLLAINSIMINEIGGRYNIITEQGSVADMFSEGEKKSSYNYYSAGERKRKKLEKETNEAKRQKILKEIENESGAANHTVYYLFNKKEFLIANLNPEEDNTDFIKIIEDSFADIEITDYPPGFPEMYRYILEMGRISEEWKGKTYPEGFPKDVPEAGIIAEADFYKFRGRGLNQFTWRTWYKLLIKKILEYSGNNEIIKNYKNKWSSKYSSDADLIATCSYNSDWDKLFGETDLEIVAMAIDAHQENGYYENLSTEDSEENYKKLIGEGEGSFFKVGITMAGSNKKGYGDVVRNRVIFMLNNLNEFKKA